MAPKIITLSNIEALAVRLMSRGHSRLFHDDPEMKADLLLISGLLLLWLQDGTLSDKSFLLADDDPEEED
jgi:hypothetical protein